MFSFFRNKRGNIALTSAIALVPILAVISLAVELTGVSSERSRLQAVVDAAALAGANEMAIPSREAVGIETVAKQFAISAYAQVDTVTPVSFSAVVDRASGTITVTGNGTRTSMINFLGGEGTRLTATATAEMLQSTPLCILQTDYQPPAKTASLLTKIGIASASGFDLYDQAKIKAGGCLIQSNDTITANNISTIEATRVQAVRSASGTIIPSANIGALPIADPFSAMNMDPPSLSGCKLGTITVGNGETKLLPAGIHCENIRVQGNGILKLMPGDHYFVGNLQLLDNSALEGTDVVLIFGGFYKFDFGGNCRVELSARTSGRFAGFLIATHPTNYQSFTISSNNVRQLLGTIYIPHAELIISSTGSVAQESAWSVIVARAITLSKNPILVINSNYVGSGVPVPAGVGPGPTTPRLKF